MTRYNSDDGATLRGLVQGMFEDEAPSSIVLGTQSGEELKNSVKPFIVFTLVTTFLEQNFCSNIYQPLVQFTIYGDGDNLSSSNLLLAQNELLGLYDGKLLTMDNDYTMIRCDSVDQRKFKDEDKFWRIMTDFRFEIQKDVTRESV